MLVIPSMSCNFITLDKMKMAAEERLFVSTARRPNIIVRNNARTTEEDTADANKKRHLCGQR